ncbi:hypothetical protein AXX12_17595 [Anaerosporomusa subterranea]|jgi:hypothetical protein|uniref:Uncharacterized protein n=1 Tax=Anaerosporomusa subterranea TaxID=1794912 RepID=A0A154BV20_ANASB|nr:hypothetical protein [Anaerosporomusa subterranea]KYZ77873.1 hypothetical protein AXX12_17595 [Anaerosporomusa subterranea]
MTQKTNNDTSKKQSLHVTSFDGPDIQSSYDAEFDFLYSPVPVGEYPEATAADMHNKTTAAAKNQLK